LESQTAAYPNTVIGNLTQTIVEDGGI
jgi:hypothetical protein